LNPDQLGWSQSCCHYTRDVCCVVDQRKPWDSNPQAVCAAACFQDRFLIQPDDFRASCGSWNRTNGLLVQSQASLPTATVPHRSRFMTHRPSRGSRRAAGAGVEPADSWFKATHFYRQKLPRNLPIRGTGGTRTHKRSVPPPVFKTGSSSSRMTSDAFVPASCGGWNRTNIKTFRASHPAVRRPRSSCL
jgi:hypothetical protein